MVKNNMDSQSSSVCVISLDALDLNFLKDRFEHNYRASSNQDVCSNDKFYYEFEVKTYEDLDVNEEPINYKEDTEYIQCHICKIDVPQQFYYEHRNSVKHETNIKIANEAIQRLQKHVNCHRENNYNKNNSSKYFCTICTITMDGKEKINHENSIGHKNSVIVEKILIDFFYIYSNKEYGDNDNIKYKTSTASTSIIETIDSNMHKTKKKISGNTNSSEEKSVLKVIENETNITGLGDNMTFTKDTDNIKYKISTANKITTELTNNTQENIKQIPENKKISEEMSISKINENKSKITTLEDYIAFLKEKYISEEMNFKVLNDFTLDITTTDKSIVRINVENFHGFQSLSRRFSTCIVCKEIISKTTIQEHILTQCHIRLVCLPLKNKDCLRYISDIRNHCILCNMGLEGISNITSHVSTTGHLKNIKKFLISENKSSNNTTSHSQPIYMQLADTIQAEDTSQNSFEKAIHMVSNVTTAKKEDKVPVLAPQSVQLDTKLSNDQFKQVENIYEKQFCSYCNVFISIKGFQKHSNTVKHIMNTLSDLHYLMNVTTSNDSDDYICRICDEKITNSIDDVKQHTALPNHLQTYNTLLQNNNIKQLNKQTLFCTSCNEMILIKNELLHINSKEHKIQSSNNDNETIDKTLNTIPSTVEANTSTTRDAPGHFFCNICNVNVPNTKNCIEIHIKGRPHIKNMNNLFHKKESNKTGESVPKENSTVAAVIKSEINNTAQKSQTATIKHTNIVNTHDSTILKCIICDVYITNNEGNILTHVKGLNHNNNYNIVIETNGLQINDTNVFCKICSVHISLGNEIHHCKGKKHIQKLSDSKKQLT